MQPAHPNRRDTGFTLIEVMITLTILGIVMAVAIPSYTKHVQRSRRAEAQAVLMQAQQFMQRVLTANDTYMPGGLQPVLPASLQRTPEAGQQLYAISFQRITPGGYTLQAAPVPGSPASKDPCGTLTLSSTGQRTVSNSVMTAAECLK